MALCRSRVKTRKWTLTAANRVCQTGKRQYGNEGWPTKGNSSWCPETEIRNWINLHAEGARSVFKATGLNNM